MAVDAGTIYAGFDLDTSGFDSGINHAASALSDFGEGAHTEAIENIEERIQDVGEAAEDAAEEMEELADPVQTEAVSNLETAFSKLGKTIAALKIGEKLVEIGQSVVQTGMDFDSQMSRVQAISGATEEEFSRLRDAAIQMGADSVFGATDAAQALEYMGMAGWKADQMIEGLPGIMNLAAASGESLGSVSDIVTDALTAFGLKASDSAHFADILAAASSNSNTNVGLMGETFKYVAPLAGALGFSAEDTAVAIGLMANAGIKGSQAGTALRAALSSMTNPSDAAATAMDQLGLSTTDSSGEMKSLDTLMGDLRTSFAGLTEAEQVQCAASIFGQEAMSGMLAIINASEEDFNKLTTTIDGSAGATERMSGQMLDNLSGDIEGFNGALETTALNIYDRFEPALRAGVQAATGLVDAFNAEGFSGVFDAIVASAQSVDWAAIGTSIQTGVTGLFDTAGSWLGTHFEAAKTAAQSTDWAALGASIHAGAVENLDAAGAWLSGLFEAGKTAVGSIPWGEIGTAIWNGITGVIDAAGNFLSGLFTGGKDAAVNIPWDEIGTTILGGVTGVLDTAGTFLSDLFGFGKSAIESIEWSGVGSTILSGVTGAIDTAGTFLSGAFTAGKATIDGINWNGIGSTIASGVNTYIDTAGTFLSGAFTAAKTTIEGISWGDVGSKISSGLSGALDTLGKIGSNIWDTITGWFSDDEEESTQADAEAMMDGLETGITGGAGAVATAASTAATGVSTAMTNVLNLEGGKAIAANWMNGLSAGITAAQATLTANAQTVADATNLVMDTTFSAANGTTIGTVFMAGISSGFTMSSSTLSSNATTVASAAVSAASGEMSFSTGSGIGMNMVLGMAAGVRSGSSSLSSAIRSVARSAVAAARSELRINSPSGVFEDEVGAWIPSGVGVGVTKNMQDALGPIEEMRDGMISMMDGTFSGVGLGRPKAPWDNGGGYAGQSTVYINITGDWSVRSDEDRDEIIDELYERISEELRRR